MGKHATVLRRPSGAAANGPVRCAAGLLVKLIDSHLNMIAMSFSATSRPQSLVMRAVRNLQDDDRDVARALVSLDAAQEFRA